MRGIAIVSLNDTTSKKFAKQLANKLEFRHVDIDEEFDKFLVLDFRSSVLKTDRLEQKEKKIIESYSQAENIVLSISNNSFLSNSNYELLKNFQVVLIEYKNLQKTNENLQNLIKKHANICIKELDVEKLFTFIKG